MNDQGYGAPSEAPFEGPRDSLRPPEDRVVMPGRSQRRRTWVKATVIIAGCAFVLGAISAVSTNRDRSTSSATATSQAPQLPMDPPAQAGKGPTPNVGSLPATLPTKTYTVPSWGQPIPTGGTRIATYKGKGFTADLYQLEQFRALAGETGNYREASAFNGSFGVKPGDVVDVYSCVITNTGSTSWNVEPISMVVTMSYDGEDRYSRLINGQLKSKYKISNSPIVPSETLKLPPGESLATGTVKLRRAGKVLHVSIQVGAYFTPQVFGNMHIVTQ